VLLLEPAVHRDQRGYFLETWRADRHAAAGVATEFVQDNQSHSVRHTLRGLHYQVRQPQGKLVRVARGEIFDVAVDLRCSSPTFGRWVGAMLSDVSHHQLWIPPGFAHGFYVLSETADLVYKCTAYYDPADDHTLLWNDTTVGIEWPLVAPSPPLLSPKDAAGLRLEAAATYP
jgi:dTDP-4-dehydrorhamnose 3,5-epimerase